MVTTRSPLELMRRAYALGPTAVARPRRPVRPPRLHPAAAVRLPGRAGVPTPELPPCRGVPDRRGWPRSGWPRRRTTARSGGRSGTCSSRGTRNGGWTCRRPMRPANCGTGWRAKPLAVDAACHEPRHRSRHYGRACRRLHLKAGEKHGKRPGKRGERSANAARSQALRRMPKLSLAVAAASATASWPPGRWSGPGRTRRTHPERSRRATRCCSGPRAARPCGRSWPTPPDDYGRRAQSETVHGMMKRNPGECLRSVIPAVGGGR